MQDVSSLEWNKICCSKNRTNLTVSNPAYCELVPSVCKLIASNSKSIWHKKYFGCGCCSQLHVEVIGGVRCAWQLTKGGSHHMIILAG